MRSPDCETPATPPPPGRELRVELGGPASARLASSVMTALNGSAAEAVKASPTVLRLQHGTERHPEVAQRKVRTPTCAETSATAPVSAHRREARARRTAPPRRPSRPRRDRGWSGWAGVRRAPTRRPRRPTTPTASCSTRPRWSTGWRCTPGSAPPRLCAETGAGSTVSAHDRMGACTLLCAIGMALRSRELSVAEHVGDALDRLRHDPFNAVITLDADRHSPGPPSSTVQFAAGRWRGPLHGVAVGVKDLIDVAGLPTRCGLLAFVRTARGGRRPGRRAAGRSGGGGRREAAHAPVRVRAHRRCRRDRARPQPARPVADHGWVVVGVGGGGRGGAPAAGAGHRHGCEHPDARRAVRGGRAQARRRSPVDGGRVPAVRDARPRGRDHRRRALRVGRVGRARPARRHRRRHPAAGGQGGAGRGAGWRPTGGLRIRRSRRSSRTRWSGCGWRARTSSRWPRR